MPDLGDSLGVDFLGPPLLTGLVACESCRRAPGKEPLAVLWLQRLLEEPPQLLSSNNRVCSRCGHIWLCALRTEWMETPL